MSLLEAGEASTPVDAPIAQDLASRLAEIFETSVHEQPIPSRIGRYQVMGELGRGGSAVVLRAIQDGPDREVALKVLMRLPAASAMRHFRLEVTALAKVSHPGIAAIYDAGVHEFEWGACPWIAVELVPGVPITDHARAANLSWREYVALVAQACDAVGHAHLRGVIHLDLKPGNIFVQRLEGQGGPARVKVMDFGLARFVAPQIEESLTRGLPMGTIGYASPEQVSRLLHGGGEVDVRTDVYALGVILYELVRGEPPFGTARRGATAALRAITTGAAPPLRLADGRRPPPELEAVVRKAMSVSPDDRYRSAGELGDDLQRVLSGEAVRARPLTLLYRARCLATVRPALATGVLAGTIGIIAVIAGTTYGLTRALSAERLYRDQRNAVISQLQVLDTLTDARTEDVRSADVRASRETIVEMLRGMSALEPGDLHLAADVSIAIVKVGDLDFAQRDLSAARARYLEALAIDERLRAERPEDRRLADNLVRSYTRLAWVCLAAKDYQEASRWTSQAVMSAERLRELAPDNPLSTHACIEALLTQADVFDLRGRAVDARAATRRAWAFAIDLRDRWEMNPHLAEMHARALTRVLGVAESTGDDVSGPVRDSLPALKAVRRAAPTDVNLAGQLCTVYRKLHSLHTQRGDVAAADAAALEQAIVALNVWRARAATTSPGWESTTEASRVAGLLHAALQTITTLTFTGDAARDDAVALLLIRAKRDAPDALITAESLARRVVDDVAPDSPRAWLVLAECLIAGGDTAAASDAITTAMRLGAAEDDEVCLSPEALWMLLARAEAANQ